MPKIPDSVAETNLSLQLRKHLELLSRGKVRDTYNLGKLLLVVATDRLSAFDIVADRLIPGKGASLTEITVKSLSGPLASFQHHLVTWGENIDRYLPDELRNFDLGDLHSRAVIVRKLLMDPYEAVVRGYITGQAWEAYRKNDENVWGHQLPKGLEEGDKLSPPIFTPSDKAQKGHDMYYDINWFRKEYGPVPEHLALDLYDILAQHAEARELIQADTKFEFGREPDSKSHELIVADEINTPDSSRFWPRKAYRDRKPGKLPASLDKQFVRNYLLSLETPFFAEGDANHRLKVSKLDSENDAHVSWFWQVTREMPDEIVDQTVRIYQIMPGMLFSEVADPGK